MYIHPQHTYFYNKNTATHTHHTQVSTNAQRPMQTLIYKSSPPSPSPVKDHAPYHTPTFLADACSGRFLALVLMSVLGASLTP